MNLTERVLGYHARGLTASEIAKLLDGEAAAGAVRMIIEQHFGAQTMAKVGSTFDFNVTGIGLMLLATAASERGMTATELASELLRTIALENLVADVLGDTEEGTPHAQQG